MSPIRSIHNSNKYCLVKMSNKTSAFRPFQFHAMHFMYTIARLGEKYWNS